MDDRAVSAVVEKTLALGVVTLFVSLVSVAVYGGVVPDARTATGQELADRTLATACERVQQAVPPNGTAVDVRLRVRLPAQIRATGYEIRPEGRTVVLDHPHNDVSARAPLALPDSVVRVEGRWESGEVAIIRVRDVGNGLLVRLQSGADG